MATEPPTELPTELAQELSVALRAWLQALVARVDGLVAENTKLRAENTKLRAQVTELQDEVRRLKNLPKKPKGKDKRGRDVSSEKDRKGEPTPRTHAGKDVPVDRTERCRVPASQRPQGAVRDGFEETVIQELVVLRRNTQFRRERWLDKATGKVMIAPLPKGWEGFGYGPELRAELLTAYWKRNVPQPQLLAWLTDHGILMSAGELSRLLVHTLSGFEQEREAVRAAGMETTPCLQMDVTSTRVDGEARSCFVLGDKDFTVFDTRPSHDRLQTLCVLCGWDTPRYRVNADVIARAVEAEVPEGHLWRLMQLEQDKTFDAAGFEAAWSVAFEEPDEKARWVGEKSRRALHELCALAAAWHEQPGLRALKLHADEAKHFDGLTAFRGLCWIHDGRHYAKLQPGSDQVADEEVALVRAWYWGFYRALQGYCAAPEPAQAKELAARFDQFFGATPRWKPLAKRLAMSLAKKVELLEVVLSHPQMPLHNNAMEQGARVRVRKRVISGGPRSEAGRRAQDIMHSVLETARKLRLGAWAYVRDRVLRLGLIEPLAVLLRRRRLLPAPSS